MLRPMLNADTEVRCLLCDRAKRPDEPWVGPRMWHCWQPTCRHAEFYTCPDCGCRDARIVCQTCGTGCFLC